MNDREIDANMFVLKASPNNTVLLHLSDRRFKLFIYHARKLLRSAGKPIVTQLYINDHLTSYNFSILMALKRERKTRRERDCPNFEALYSIDGKVYVKINRQSPNSESFHIRTPQNISEFLQRLISRQ